MSEETTRHLHATIMQVDEAPSSNEVRQFMGGREWKAAVGACCSRLFGNILADELVVAVV